MTGPLPNPQLFEVLLRKKEDKKIVRIKTQNSGQHTFGGLIYPQFFCLPFKKFNTYVIENGVIGEGEGERRRESKRDWSSRQKETREPKKIKRKRKRLRNILFLLGRKRK